MKRRVILFANTSWYLWNFRRELARTLQQSGFEIVFAAPRDAYSRRLQTIAPFTPIDLSRSGRNPFIEMWALLRIARAFQNIRPDTVLTWTPKPNIYSALVARMLGVNVVPNVAGLGTQFVRRNATSRLTGAMYRASFSRLATVFFQNRDDRDEFIASGWVRREAARVLPGSGVDLTRFRATAVPENDPYVFMFAGRLLVEKGLPDLVSAAGRLRDEGFEFSLRVYGHFDPGNPSAISERTMQRWVKSGDVDYRGAVDVIEDEIRAADCIVLPSYYREGVPRILLEAAASGRPVIATDSIGCRDAVKSEVTGLLCKPRDVDDLERAMQRMLAMSPQQRAEMGQAARRLAESRFDEKLVIDAYIDALQSPELNRAS